MSETQQTRVVAVLDDMFFSSKIKEAAKQTDLNLEIIKDADGLVESLRKAPPKLILVDLNSKKLNPLSLIGDINSESKLQGITTIGYLPHVEEELKKKAIQAGFDKVMPRSRFSRELPQILKKYAQ